MKFRIKDAHVGYRLEVGVPTLIANGTPTGQADALGFTVLTWVPLAEVYGSIESARIGAQRFTDEQDVIEYFEI